MAGSRESRDKNLDKPILVTGGHRSGTTWVGRNLALAPRTKYIHEPFNINNKKIPVINNPLPFWFQYISNDNEHLYKSDIEKVLRHQYPLTSNLKRVRRFRQLAIIIVSQGVALSSILTNARPIMKDPIALFSSEWLSKSFNMDVLVMIRHPAAFCSSIKVKGWTFDFNNFVRQPELMDGYLRPFNGEIHDFAKKERDIIDQAILLWNCIYHTVSIYQSNNPEWLFVRHEDISNYPLEGFEDIYNKLGLNFTKKSKAGILESSGDHNPVEQIPGNELKRNSKENINNWKKRLTQEESERIKSKTQDIASIFYNDYNWYLNP